MFTERPHANTVVLAVVELCDGRKVMGVVGGFTVESDNNRELRLVRPLGIQWKADGLVEKAEDLDFLLLRESEIRCIIGRYVRGKDEPSETTAPAPGFEPPA